MFMYYRLYKKPVSPMISTPRFGDQEKMAIPGVEVVHEKAKSVRQVFLLFLIFFERTSSLSAGQSLVTTSTSSS